MPPMTVIAIPRIRPDLVSTRPVTVGRVFVRSIIASISRSYKLLNTPAAPIIREDPIKERMIGTILAKIEASNTYKAKLKPANMAIRLDLMIPILIVSKNTFGIELYSRLILVCEPLFNVFKNSLPISILIYYVAIIPFNTLCDLINVLVFKIMSFDCEQFKNKVFFNC